MPKPSEMPKPSDDKPVYVLDRKFKHAVLELAKTFNKPFDVWAYPGSATVVAGEGNFRPGPEGTVLLGTAMPPNKGYRIGRFIGKTEWR